MNVTTIAERLVAAIGPSTETTPAHRILSLRAALLLGSAAIAVAAVLIGDPAVLKRADPELATLLRAMALIKGSVVVSALGVLAWRFRWPTSAGMASSYLMGAWAITGAAVSIWQRSYIALAALAFHGGCLTLLFTALRDRHGAWRIGFPRSSAS